MAKFIKKYLMTDELFLVTLTSSFLFILWVFDPANKVIFVILAMYLFLLDKQIKDISLSLLLTFILSGIFFVGKTYSIQLHDLKQFPDLLLIYPQGLVNKITLTFSDMIFVAIILNFILSIKKINFKNLRPILLDFVILLFFIYGIFADIASSKRLYFSLLFKKELFEYVFIYFYLRFFFTDHKRFFNLLTTLLAVMVVFESYVSILQFIQSAPMGKSIESVHGLSIFGAVPDELTFTFRPIGTFIFANNLGAYIAAIIPLLFIKFIQRSNWIFTIAFFFGMTTLFITLSRSAWFGGFIAILFLIYIIEYRLKYNLMTNFLNKKTLFFLILLSPLIFYSFPRITRSVYSFQESGGFYVRLQQISSSLKLLEQHPMIGIGTAMGVVEAIEADPTGVFASFPSPIHNYYFLTLVENGIPAFLLLIGIIILGLRKILSFRTIMSYTMTTVFISIIIVALFQPFLNFELLFICIALKFDKINHDAKITS